MVDDGKEGSQSPIYEGRCWMIFLTGIVGPKIVADAFSI